MTDLVALGSAAKAAAEVMAGLSTDKKDKLLSLIATGIKTHAGEILKANMLDIKLAQESGMSPAMLDRLTLNIPRIEGIIDAVIKVSHLPDPIGEIIERRTMYNGIELSKVRVPLGVIGIIYESRPNVTVDAAVLCLKSGNAAFLRGGKETINTNLVLEGIMHSALDFLGLPIAAVTLLHDTSRETAHEMMRLKGYIDLLIPRGSARLIGSVVENATVPYIETGVGNCHIFVDATADLQQAAEIIFNAKTQRISVCNSAETLLVHAAVAEAFLPMAKALLDSKKVELRGCPETARILGDCVVPATEEDYDTEFLDYILAVRVVPTFEEGLRHVQKHTTHHSEAILTSDTRNADRFAREIDAACVYVNASTRFTDGEEMGFGAEIGISTQKMHARGPMGLKEMCSYKYIMVGDGQVRK